MSCSGCSGGKKVGYVGRGTGSLQFNGITLATERSILVVISYVNGGSPRTCRLSVDGRTPVTLTFPGTADWSTPGALTVRMTLRAGSNTLLFTNPTDPAPDFDRLILLG